MSRSSLHQAQVQDTRTSHASQSCATARRATLPGCKRLCAGLGGLTPRVLLCTPACLMTSCLRSGLAGTHHVQSFELAPVLLALLGDVWCAWKRGCAPVLTAILSGSDCV